ncbi:MAG: hypothetical protein JWR14_3464 [Caballeronia sp.]|jgi:type IV pilus assembly protein PilE|uniref:type IV pilin protein n=1 Tax=Caballeronia sp. TaxID=1931223 RepID=UPI002A4DB814|nr:hypothetical protein [Caballeronia sp.]
MTMVDKGFTLLELMITLGVAAIIATFAMPVYREQVARGHRLDAVSALYRAAQYVERARTISSNDVAAKLPLGLDQAPALGTPIYVLRMLGESEQNGGHSIEAQPVDANDACGIYSLDATGVRSNRSAKKSHRPKWRRAGAENERIERTLRRTVWAAHAYPRADTFTRPDQQPRRAPTACPDST